MRAATDTKRLAREYKISSLLLTKPTAFFPPPVYRPSHTPSSPPKKTSSLSAAIADASEVYRHSGADRHNSLAYSSSSEMSGSEVEAITQPRDRIGELASQATGVVPASLGGSRRETPSAPTVASSGRRALRPNEMEALLQVCWLT